MLQELLTLNVWAFFLIFARVGTALITMPGFGSTYVPVRIRAAFGLFLSFVLLPVVAADLPVMPVEVGPFFIILIREMLIGAFFGAIGRIILGCLQTAGTLISLYSSLANALIQDPIAEQQSSTVAGMLSTIGLLIVFTTDLHHLMLRAITDSYGLFEAGAPVLIGDHAEMITRKVAASFTLGLQMASPFILTAITYYVGLGLLGRLNPQLQVFFIGMPIQITMQIALIGVVLSGTMMVFTRYLSESFGAFIAP